MNPRTLNPTTPAPLVARRVQPPQAKPVAATQPTTLETVAKVVNDVAKIADVVGKFFKSDVKPAARAATPVQPDFAGQSEMLPDTAFGGGGDWGFGGVPEMPALPEPQGWDFSQMLGFDPNTMTGGFDPNTLTDGMDPNAGW